MEQSVSTDRPQATEVEASRGTAIPLGSVPVIASFRLSPVEEESFLRELGNNQELLRQISVPRFKEIFERFEGLLTFPATDRGKLVKLVSELGFKKNAPGTPLTNEEISKKAVEILLRKGVVGQLGYFVESTADLVALATMSDEAEKRLSSREFAESLRLKSGAARIPSLALVIAEVSQQAAPLKSPK